MSKTYRIGIAVLPLMFSLMAAFAGDERHPGLLDPSKATEKAPAEYRVKFETTKGSFTVLVKREWSPLGRN